MSELLDAEAWLDSQLAAANPPTDTPPPAQELAALPQPGVSPFLSNPPEDPAKPQGLYNLGEGQAPEQTNRILYPRYTDVTLPQTARGPVPDEAPSWVQFGPYEAVAISREGNTVTATIDIPEDASLGTLLDCHVEFETGRRTRAIKKNDVLRILE